jgi:uncharacterized protein (TIGR03435 family)
MMRTVLLFVATFTAALGAAPQDAQPASSVPAVFEVVSIKENPSGRDGGGSTPLRNGRWQATNVPLLGLIASAWGIPGNRVFGAPDWARVTRYDIAAVAPASATQEQIWPMVQALLRDRFRVAAHTETRDLPVYHLAVARTGNLGPGLKVASVDCDAPDWRDRVKADSSLRPCGFSWDVGMLTGGGTRMSTLASLVSSEAGRPVFDRTGLTGGYDFDLKWTPGLGADPAGNAVSIFTALQEQLGLKLESATAPLDVLVVDHVEHPTAN